MAKEIKVEFREYAVIHARRKLYPEGKTQTKEPFIRINGKWYRLLHVTSQPSIELSQLEDRSLGP